MTDPIEVPLDDEDRLADPPLVDSLHYENELGGFSITFVPSAGNDPTKTVFVPRDSDEGRLVATYTDRIRKLIGNENGRVCQGGGGHFPIRLAGGRTVGLSDEAPKENWRLEVFDRLKQIADVAEAAFIGLHAGQR